MAPSATTTTTTATITTTSSHHDFADPDALRTAFTLAMSSMYKAEVPLYGTLIHIVNAVNASTRTADLDPRVLAMRHGNVASSRLDIERHGAIRLGTPYELRTVRRIFAIIGLHPVGYYNLAAAGLPMHATCFRPRSTASLKKNPFRVFTSLLRPELIRDDEARSLALKLLSKRNIFTAELINLLDLADKQGGRLTVDQGTRFVIQAMETFRWHGTAASSHDDYQLLKREHQILADIACFRSAHINHLTPRTLDISAAQEEMKSQGLKVKDRIEGPPGRNCPILLRQTSFLAIEEPVQFFTAHTLQSIESEAKLVSGSHKARFGEIEERGAAVTVAGRQLYDELLNEAMAAAESTSQNSTPEELDRQVEVAFQKYPDDWKTLRAQKLVYFTYNVTNRPLPDVKSSFTLEHLIQQGVIDITPITYEDFLPLSAAGIFRSNLGTQASSQSVDALSNEAGMEEALGAKLNSSDELYKSMENESIRLCEAELGIKIIV
ncbi:uncharacterized protein TrAFT101_002189 [Trichoderma asperellum]|uniref:2-oxoadipate dioxygenase/decarboxylase n=1 Tax=Trichoderma asperellum (strain ATCC 204424 / CBS 433.97 / NBRC 101777) TaxID=1042311 RepID=A0A2T3ZFP5_TRIA4|nr:hypothetical protein M441DRAFT_376325 [Trichoderma asperellum CBS 433.97]PTB43631.1 hypothetical protein M441DRAFT_376325 [Trichoderma asperellum CBS 433.97]UKZ86354.1 hypothetical protein TrAFT101_002189 [Trichoderma asperellum]